MRTHGREQKWKNIFDAQACFYFEPFVIDHLLSGEDPCDASRRAGYADGYDVENDKNGLSNFLKRASAKLCKEFSSHISESAFDELSAMVRSRVLEAIPQYRPGQWAGGEFVPWGFEAFLYNFPIKKAHTDFLRELRRSSGVRLEQPTGEDETRTVLEALESGGAVQMQTDVSLDAIEMAFEQSLIVALKNSPGRQEYLLYNGYHMTIEDIAKHLGDTVSGSYRRLCLAADAVVDALQERIAFLLGTSTEKARVEILGYLRGNEQRYRLRLDEPMSAAYHSLINGDDSKICTNKTI